MLKNYKRVCLKNHPDKGGDANLFAEMASAYNALLIIQDYEDKYADCEVVEYELVLIKGKQGLGFAVAEDRAKGGVYVSDVHENIQVVGITAESQGEIRIHDRILGIDKDDASSTEHQLTGKGTGRVHAEHLETIDFGLPPP